MGFERRRMEQLVASTHQSSQPFLTPRSGHYEFGPYDARINAEVRLLQNNMMFGSLLPESADSGFVRAPHMDSNNCQGHLYSTLNSLQGGQHGSSNGPCRDVSLPVDNFQTRNIFSQGEPVSNGQPRPRQRKRRRDSNWTKEETSVLVDLKDEAICDAGSRFSKGSKPNATNWDAISAALNQKLQSSAKTGDQCRLRWDTLVKSYQKIKRTRKEFSELTEEERGELRLATSLSEGRWYEVIDRVCRPKVRKVRGGDRKRAFEHTMSPQLYSSPESAGKPYCEKQIAIPGFKSLSITRRSTLLDLVNGSIILADLPWVSNLLNVRETCQWLSIVQNRSPSNINWDVCSLVKKKIVHKVSAENGKVHLNLQRLHVYSKFAKKVASRNPDFDTYRRIWSNASPSLSTLVLPDQRITALTLGKCLHLVEADLQHLPKLRCLVITGCVKLQKVTGWERLLELGWLVVENCPAYKNHPTVQRLPSLKSYFFSNVELNDQLLPWSHEPPREAFKQFDVAREVTQFIQMTQFIRLCRLEIFENKFLKETGDLSALKCLQVLRFRYCYALCTIRGLSDLCSLTTLDLSFCSALSWLPNVRHLKALTVLDIFGTAMEEISGIEELVSLERLDCTKTKLKRLPSLYHLPQLQRITLRETALVEDSKSMYFGKGLVELYGDEERRMECVDVSDVSDEEHVHSEFCEISFQASDGSQDSDLS